ncbi:FGGY carbohydrate kinase domain-containing protein [Drosophila sulfurigaster albostrigata]|uniref:FGGY carbohydrate kinase domain-containing protein n=1 Tax=Drosophila sulfurigaster albostrigata TaxID=89887 RepID=UPI002D21A3AD|nr:FGGY carbohydrate kinase domain-containing protein [Drosophila sulfurigaster albostrigata]XP_062129515.1 FGGY carbohydrate kinase domain-containing protein [Drosophila sulfurigaster albostrigata]
MSEQAYFVGVDVGTGSARAALVAADGRVQEQAVEAIKTWTPEPHYYEQSSEDIWQAICKVVKHVIAGVDKQKVKGIGFDATCSLVILGNGGTPVTVSKSGVAEQNIILWMDHRAEQETAQINAAKHPLLKYVGGQVSLEMEIPKLLWLKRHLPKSYGSIWRAFDLPDFLTWRATEVDTRSLCSVVCKWNYDAAAHSWNSEFLRGADLEELTKDKFAALGSDVQPPGKPVGKGLSQRAANELGLQVGTVVSTSLIDAHAGALGMFGCRADNSSSKNDDVQGKMALIAGTSTCHMSITRNACFAKGIWGPYQDAIIPGYFLNEGGQSVAGHLLDHVLKTHECYFALNKKLGGDKFIYQHLNKLLEKLAAERGFSSVHCLTQDIHVWPDLHGNRSPVADATLRGTITGLDMTRGVESLAIKYLAFTQALAYGTRHIIENLYEHQRAAFQTLLFCGGLAKNPLYVQCHADICNLPALIPNEQEMVLVGAAALGAAAAGHYDSVESASKAMGGTGQLLKPNPDTVELHNRKYKVFLKLLEHQRQYRDIMQGRQT